MTNAECLHLVKRNSTSIKNWKLCCIEKVFVCLKLWNHDQSKQKCPKPTLLKYVHLMYKYITRSQKQRNKHTPCKQYKSIRFKQWTIGFGNFDELKKCLCTSDPRITISRQAEMTSIGFGNYKHTPKKPKTNKQMHILQTI